MRLTQPQNHQDKLLGMITIRRAHLDKMYAHARESLPGECCGLVGGKKGLAHTVYPLRNVAADALVAYEAAPEDIFATQKLMRQRGEQLVAIYHSHPRSSDPVPSETDVRLAFYPQAIYFIVGLGETDGVLRAFHIFEANNTWQHAEYRVAD